MRSSYRETWEANANGQETMNVTPPENGKAIRLFFKAKMVSRFAYIFHRMKKTTDLVDLRHQTIDVHGCSSTVSMRVTPVLHRILKTAVVKK